MASKSLNRSFAIFFILISPLALSVENSDETKREKAAAEDCQSRIGQEHQYILHSWAKSVLGFADFGLFTDYIKTGEDKDEKRGIPIHYDQSPEGMHQKIFSEYNEAPDKTNINYFLEDKYIKIQLIRQQPYAGAKPDPNATIVTEYYIAADTAKIPSGEYNKAEKSGDITALLNLAAKSFSEDGNVSPYKLKFPLVVKNKKRSFNGVLRVMDKTIYTQLGLEETFEVAALRLEKEISESLTKNEISRMNKGLFNENKSGLRKLAEEQPQVAPQIREAQAAMAQSNAKLREEAKLRLSGCAVNESGWQEAIRKKTRDDINYARYSLLYIDIIREIISSQDAEVQSGYVNGPVPEIIPWKPDDVSPGEPLHKAKNPYEMKGRK